ncbi:MAG: helix-turn-helix domain-containing protein [Vicinamibacteria bacterium]|nr:helix-turn-helix domain-containing protein [Vicinamibacteria bacterium]
MESAVGLDRKTCERASRARDPRFDGRFFIGVTTTRIYCRPICPAVAPRPANKHYFPTAAAAAEAGFRPCLRCRPEAAPGTPAWLGTSTTVRRGLALIQAGALDEGSVDELAVRLGVGSRHLHRLFVQHLGASPVAVAQTRRLHFAKRLLDETDLGMTEIALASGFGSVRRFNDAFRDTYQRSPSEIRRGRPGPLPSGPESGIRSRHQPTAALRFRLAYRPPYDFDGVLSFLATRAVPGVEGVESGVYRRVVRAGGQLGTIAVRHVAAARAIELELRHPDPRVAFGVVQRVRALFDLGADPAPIALAFRDDPMLAACVAAAPGQRLPGAFDPFELAVRAVLGQQVSVAAARTFAARLAARHGTALPTPADGLTHAFPDAAALAAAPLDGVGLTGARVRTLQGLARAVADGSVRFDDDPDDVRRALLALPGFGPWTVEYVMLRGVGDPDAFPAGDLALRKRLAGTGHGPVSERALAARAESWRPWRGYAVFHLWRSLATTPSKRERSV